MDLVRHDAFEAEKNKLKEWVCQNSPTFGPWVGHRVWLREHKGKACGRSCPKVMKSMTHWKTMFAGTVMMQRKARGSPPGLILTTVK